MDAKIIFWQVLAAYAFALAGGVFSASLRLSHKPLCALISFAPALFSVLRFLPSCRKAWQQTDGGWWPLLS
jgi:hypothetical protein